MSPNQENITVRELSPGQTATVTGYETSDAHYRSKLLSMGLTRGTELKLVKVAPLGDPVEIEVRGYRLSLRKKEAEALLLKRNGNSP
ncbi:MAG: ferrous iron transport protein A [Spirochaetaceae bacterium]